MRKTNSIDNKIWNVEAKQKNKYMWLGLDGKKVKVGSVGKCFFQNKRDLSSMVEMQSSIKILFCSK